MTTAIFRNNLPQAHGEMLLTDGGLETTLIFLQGIDLPHFAAFDLLRTKEGRQQLKTYYRRYAALAAGAGTGFVLETPTWRASRDWGLKLGYSDESLAAINGDAIELMEEIRDEFTGPGTPFVISGNLGPRGDGYVAGHRMAVDEAESYHGAQIAAFAQTSADLITAMTMNYVEEAIGAARAAAAYDMPAVISFTVETDGRLPSGQDLGGAIEQVEAESASPAYYMINCAHPDHFRSAVATDASWVHRIKGLRANASRQSHAELDNADELDDGNPVELSQQYRELMGLLPDLTVLGGCCGTDHRHVEAIGHACFAQHAAE